MTVADYALAVLGLLACLAWCGGSWLVTLADPANDAESAATTRKGCAALIVGLAAAAWFVGVLWTGEWGWL